MHFSSVIFASLAILQDVQGHAGLPKLLGRQALESTMKEKRFVGPVRRSVRRSEHVVMERSELERRQGGTGNTDGQCGGSFGSCADGYCCSSAGWCGNTVDYCKAPDCQINYGPGCDSLKVPPGASTANTPRTKVGSVPYGGAGIYACSQPGTVAITYDDGPFQYTNRILDLLNQYGAKATFFITGNNIGKGQIQDQWASVIQRMNNDGHQIASHTWGHEDLSAITAQQRKDQMVNNEIALNDILGFFPTYMRPPYSSCTDACQQAMADLGYHITYFDLDTDDYRNTTPDKAQIPKDNFSGNLTTRNPSSGDWLVIAHDIHQQTAEILTEFMLQQLQAGGWRGVTVGECLNDPKANWYRTISGGGGGGGGGGNPSDDGTCGPVSGKTCTGASFGNCCSQYGWCGSTSDHCDAGCQPDWGTCSGGGGGGTPVSPDGTCGPAAGFTCAGSPFGQCCSQYGWCGDTTDHCGNGCQSGFGTCN